MLIKSDPPLKNTFIQLLKLHFSARSSVKFLVQVLRTGEQNMVCSKNDAIESTDPKLSASLSLCSCTLSHIVHSFLHFTFLDVMDRTQALRFSFCHWFVLFCSIHLHGVNF